MRAIQVSDVDDRSCGAPRWSPDGGRLAFDCSGTDGYQVFVSNADGGPSKQLTFGEPPSFAPSWSPDGQTVYFQRSGVPGLWVVGVEGGELEQLNQHRMARPVVSPDGEWAAFGEVGEDGAALWRASMRGGETVLLSDDIRTYSTAFDFAADGSIYYIENASGTDESTHLVKRWDPTTGLVREVTAIQGRLPRSYKFAIAPDGSWFLYVRESEPQSDLMVIEDFQ